MPEPWLERFRVPLRHAVRPARGGADVAHVLSVGAAGPELAVWHPATGELAAADVDGDLLESLPTADGRGVLRLRDDSGAEMGHVWLADLATGEDRDLTPGLPDYTVRGLDTSADGRVVLLTVASERGYEVVAVSGDDVAVLRSTRNEAWNGRVSASGATVAVDTTDHVPGIRRFGVTAIDAASGRELGLLFDAPDGPARVLRFSPVPGDERLLAISERTGFSRPVIWNPRTGDRSDLDLPDLEGEVMPLDWSPDARRLLVAHVDSGVHRLLEIDLLDGTRREVPHPAGSVFRPDIASSHLFVVASHYAPSGEVRVTLDRYDRPLEVRAPGVDGAPLLAGERAPHGEPFASHLVTAVDGLRSQLWVGRPRGAEGPRPTILEVHGGPTYLTPDHFDPVAQAWLDEGYAFASLNFRGSVTFGRDFREAVLGQLGQGETDDIRAAVDHLVAAGIADRDAVFITGESYGGFLTLMSLAKLPELFRGGFALVAMADWSLAYEGSNPGMRRALAWFLGATDEGMPEAMRRASVTTYVDAIRSPVWIKNGRQDTRTPPRQIEHFADLLRTRGGDVTLEWFDGGHTTASSEALVEDLRTMLRLSRAALRGERWSAAPDTPEAP